MSLFSSILCCTSDITSNNNNNNSNNNNTGNNRNRNTRIRTDNKDYSKYLSIKNNSNNNNSNNNNSNKNNNKIRNQEMMSKIDRNKNNKKNKNIGKSILTEKQQPIKNSTNNKNKFEKMVNINDGGNDMLVDPNDADEEKDYEDSDDMDIDDEVPHVDNSGNADYTAKLNSTENTDENLNIHTNSNENLKNKDNHTISVYTNETDRSSGSSDYGNIQQQLPQENLENELSKLTTVSLNENDIPSSTIIAPSPMTNNTLTVSNDGNGNNNISNNNIHDNNNNNINNINSEPVISATLTMSATNTTTTNSQNPISNIDQNGISMDSDNGNDDIDYDMIHPFDENEEYVDLTMLQPDQYHAPGFNTLLSPKDQIFKNKKLLVLDLDETLVHSSFKYLRSADFVLPVDIDDQIHNVYVIKRPGVDEFLKKVGELFEVVVFTASVSRYGDPLLDILDKHKSIHHRLFREACYNYEGNYIKNLSQLGRPLSDIIILDNSPASYIFHPQHAIPISSWFSDTHDNELLDIIPLLEDLAKQNILDVGKVLDVSI